MLAAEEMDAFLFEPGVPDPQTCQLGLRPLSAGAPPIPNMLADAGVNLLCELLGEGEGEWPEERVEEPEGLREVS